MILRYLSCSQCHAFFCYLFPFLLFGNIARILVARGLITIATDGCGIVRRRVMALSRDNIWWESSTCLPVAGKECKCWDFFFRLRAQSLDPFWGLHLILTSHGLPYEWLNFKTFFSGLLEGVPFFSFLSHPRASWLCVSTTQIFWLLRGGVSGVLLFLCRPLGFKSSQVTSSHVCCF